MSFIFLLLYIAAIYIRPQEWVPAIYGLALIYWLMIITAFFVFAEISMRKKAHLTEMPNLLMFGFFAFILMSHVSHTYLQGTINSFINFAPNVVMFFLFVNILLTNRHIKISIWLIIILTLILAIEGIQQHNTGVGWAGQAPIWDATKGESRIRWVGVFNDPNDLALLFVVGAGFLLSFLFGRVAPFAKILSAGMLTVIGPALFYTNSRGGFLAMAATVTFFFLRKMKNKFVALVIGGCMAFFVILVGPSRLTQLSASEASAYGRVEAWYHGFQMLKKAPFFGVGYRMFTDYAYESREAHNSYIEVAAELGIVGLFVWISLIYLCFKGLALIRKKDTAIKPYAMGLEASLFGFLSASYFLSRSYISLLYILFALSAASMYVNLKKEEYILTRRDIKLSIGLTLGILVLVWSSMHLFI